ncbi:MAG: DegT/DnrJ/EryC1/StrS family aminotransferase [Nitrospirota bacterium]|nr:DegT/DnrJ/EryC1/StrS family aminotransferase [Nitrospirota bacterium]
MRVPLLDLKLQYASIRDEVRPVVDEVMENQYFILGPNVTGLEEEVARYSQSKYGIGVTSGTDALLIALMALDIGPDDAVITTPYTFFATGGVVHRLGALPLFLDIDEASYNIDPAQVEQYISCHCVTRDGALFDPRLGRKVRVLMPVHLYGQCADMDALSAIAEKYGLAIIEDAAQAIGSEWKGRRAGSMGTIGCFSFFPSKNLGGFGDGGMVTVSDDALAEKLRILRVHGSKPKYYHKMVGGNFRLDELQAAVLRVKLRHLDAWTEGRQKNAALYRSLFKGAGLDGKIGLPKELSNVRHIYNQFVIRAPRRDELMAHLKAQGIGTEIYYPLPLHLQECFSDLGYKTGDLPISEKAAAETVAVPIFPELTEEQIRYVVESIAAFYS